MNRKLLAIFIFSLFFISIFSSSSFAVEGEKIKISINNQDSSIELSIDEAEQIKNKFLDIEYKFNGAEKIREQLKIMHEIGALPTDFSLEFLYSLMDTLSNLKDLPFFFPRPHLIVGGPMIVSHFTLGGRIIGILPLRNVNLTHIVHELKGIFNGSFLDQYIGFLPFYLGISFNPVFVTAIGLQIIQSKKIVFFPFIELLMPCFGTSIAFYYKTQNPKKDPLFEYNIDVCLAGFIGGL